MTCPECGGMRGIPSCNPDAPEGIDPCPVCNPDGTVPGRLDTPLYYVHKAVDRAGDCLPMLGLFGFLAMAWINIFAAFGAKSLDAWAWGILCSVLALGFAALFLAGSRDDNETEE